jgi:hypothetical protein
VSTNVSSVELHDAIYNIKSNAAGIDGIPLRLIKAFLPVVFPFLLNIYNIYIWSSENGLSLNTNKTLSICFSRREIPNLIPPTIGGVMIGYSDVITNLDVKFDKNLSW